MAARGDGTAQEMKRQPLQVLTAEIRGSMAGRGGADNDGGNL